MFNALKYTKNLQESGFERDQAEILVGMFMQMIEFNMVTKSEFEKFQTEVYHRFEKVDVRFKNIDERFDSLEQRIDSKLNRLSLQLTIKLGVLLALSVGLLSTILAIKL